MPQFPDDLVRPINVMIKDKGARIAFRPPKDVPAEDIVKYVIFRSTTYDWKSPCSALETPGKFENLTRLEATESPFIDTQFPEPRRYSYYIFAVDRAGNYHFPGMATGKQAELGITLMEAKPGDVVRGVISSSPEPVPGQGSYPVTPAEEKELRARLARQDKLWTPRRQEWTDSVLDALKRRDEQGYWVAVKMGTIAPEVFLTFVDAADDLFSNAVTLVHELTHIGSSRGPVIKDRDLMGKATSKNIDNENYYYYVLLIDDAAWGCVLPRPTFIRSKIVEAVPDYPGKGEFEREYLVKSGRQDLQSVLNEVNAYCRGLRTKLCLLDQVPASKRPGETVTRDLCIFMLFTEVYLRVARTKFPKDYQLLARTPEVGLMLMKIWHNCEQLLAHAARQEMQHDAVYEVVDSEGYASELKAFFKASKLEYAGAKPVEEVVKTGAGRNLVVRRPH